MWATHNNQFLGGWIECVIYITTKHSGSHFLILSVQFVAEQTASTTHSEQVGVQVSSFKRFELIACTLTSTTYTASEYLSDSGDFLRQYVLLLIFNQIQKCVTFLFGILTASPVCLHSFGVGHLQMRRIQLHVHHSRTQSEKSVVKNTLFQFIQ